MDTNKKASRKEAAGSREAMPAATKKLPIKVIRSSDVSVSIFAHAREISGGKRVNYSCSFQRSYKDRTGEWQRTQWFGLDDLANLVDCAQQASEYIRGLNEQDAD